MVEYPTGSFQWNYVIYAIRRLAYCIFCAFWKYKYARLFLDFWDLAVRTVDFCKNPRRVTSTERCSFHCRPMFWAGIAADQIVIKRDYIITKSREYIIRYLYTVFTEAVLKRSFSAETVCPHTLSPTPKASFSLILLQCDWVAHRVFSLKLRNICDTKFSICP